MLNLFIQYKAEDIGPVFNDILIAKMRPGQVFDDLIISN